MRNKPLVIVRGGGDIATGTIHKLFRSGFPVIVLETAHPSAIRRHVAFSEAVYEKSWSVEGVTAVRAETTEEAEEYLENGCVPIMIDERADCIRKLRPEIVVDGILAKKNLGTTMEMAETVIALGPGFTAGKDAHLVIETQRGHDLGRIITEGCALANTGVPGVIGGYGKERVIHSPAAGTIHNLVEIGEKVVKGQTIARVDEVPVTASIDGILRGLIREGYPVRKGFKIADIDPREDEQKNCFTISDKARCIAGSVLEGILMRTMIGTGQQEEAG
ncbi:MAG: EF2563 family selenium-dependent molybdenum hydroxylase system protein [Clostridiales bacterium]|nr:EF2563 family selenium-dependent molybdenum hydroxylase system protein [Clostridiales bacterium]